MSTYIEMPKLSDTMSKGTVARWHKAVGDTVDIGDVIAEIETDKAVMEMEAFDEGVLHEIYVTEGGEAAIGQRLALLLASGESAPDSAAPLAPVEVAPPPSLSPTRIKASPLAKKIARAQGLELDRVKGSGPGGRIVASDIEAKFSRSDETPAIEAKAVTPQTLPVVATQELGQTRVPLSGMRKVIAERLLSSKTQIPHFYLNIEVDVGKMLALRVEVNKATEGTDEPKVTINDFVLKAAAIAATRVPRVNASFDGDAIVEFDDVNLAVAVAVDDGLITPVVRDAGRKSLGQISGEVKDLALRARNRQLKPHEYENGTLTVSNLGSYGIESFSAIINPPQALILSVGAIVKKPVVNDKDEIVVGQRMSIGLSADHRVVDGAVAAKYLGELRRLLENPLLVLL
ncbi:2-oxo acid dehydrogenase subunit E2 [bacterium]|nr:MAG: 2-oxo acid dehydrogenase subunit E2 [bacterium]